jgi:hypothetical protein
MVKGSADIPYLAIIQRLNPCDFDYCFLVQHLKHNIVSAYDRREYRIFRRALY